MQRLLQFSLTLLCLVAAFSLLNYIPVPDNGICWNCLINKLPTLGELGNLGTVPTFLAAMAFVVLLRLRSGFTLVFTAVVIALVAMNYQVLSTITNDWFTALANGDLYFNRVEREPSEPISAQTWWFVFLLIGQLVAAAMLIAALENSKKTKAPQSLWRLNGGIFAAICLLATIGNARVFAAILLMAIVAICLWHFFGALIVHFVQSNGWFRNAKKAQTPGTEKEKEE